MLKIVIHRPAQIGGQITKIVTADTSIIIDLGHNLPGEDKEDALDNKEAIEEITRGCSAVLYTHYHGDHIGLFHHVPKAIPQYIGVVAKQVVCRKYQQLCYLPDETAKDVFGKALETAKSMRTFHERETITLGSIRVTPYFVSHSAYDAYMFLIEAEGKRILHTGDFRGHGYLSKGLLPTIRKYIGQVDILITEGTMLRRQDEQVWSEAEISLNAQRLLKEHKYVFIHCSSTDMERLASFKNAHTKCHPHRPLVVDQFQKDILDIFSNTAGKKSDCFDFGKVYCLPDSFNKTNQRLKDWMLRDGFTMFVRPTEKFHNYICQILETIAPEKPLFIYSMWSGYIDNEKTLNKEYIRLQNRFGAREIRRLHTSGHATVKALIDVCEAVNPQLAIIPVHRDVNTDFRSIDISTELKNRVITLDSRIEGVDIVFV